MTTTINYDAKYDVFYVRPTASIDSYADEDDDGIITLRSILDDSIVGMVIYDFKRKARNGTLQKSNLPLPLDYNDPRVAQILITQ